MNLLSRSSTDPVFSSPDPDVLLPEDAAARLRVPKTWVYAHFEQIPGHFRLGRYLRFRRRVFERWLEGNGTCQ